MNNSSNENNFSFVYSCYTDPRMVEGQRVQEEVISHCKRHVEIVTKEMNELKALLAAITMKYKVAEDARRVTFKRNSLLMDDNEFLKEKLKETEMMRAFAEKSKCQLEKVVQEKGDIIKRLETALKDIINEGLPDKKKRRSLLFRDRTTSTTDLKSEAVLLTAEEETQAVPGEPQAEKPLDELEYDKTSEVTSIVQSEHLETASLAPTLEDKPITFIEDEKKRQKRITPEPISSKDRETGRAQERFRHVRLVRVMQELERQKHMNSWKNSELNNKTRELKMKEGELAEARKEIMILKNKLTQNSLAKMRLNAKRRIENAANNAKKFPVRQEAKYGVKTPIRKETDKENEE